MAYSGTRRKVFISHYKGDHDEVQTFLDTFGDKEKVFIPKVLGANENYEFANSTDTDYVMSQIRQKYLEDSTITIVLMGSCTHSRRYVDWEIKSSLTQGSQIPNGLLGIILPSRGNSAHVPERFALNWESGNQNCYAKYYVYPSSADQLGGWIEDAFNARIARAPLINNPRGMMGYNVKCKVHDETH